MIGRRMLFALGLGAAVGRAAPATAAPAPPLVPEGIGPFADAQMRCVTFAGGHGGGTGMDSASMNALQDKVLSPLFIPVGASGGRACPCLDRQRFVLERTDSDFGFRLVAIQVLTQSGPVTIPCPELRGRAG
jgi:hypothetical protein